MKTKHHSAVIIRQNPLLTLGLTLITIVTVFTTVPSTSAQTSWGGALSLDGANDYLRPPPGSWFSNEFTIETWIYDRSYREYAPVAAFGSQYNDAIILFISREYVGFQFPRDPWIPSSMYASGFPLNQWVHLAVTINSNTAIMYVNGVRAGSLNLQSPIYAGANRTNNAIGCFNYGAEYSNYLDAILEDLRVWSVARTAEQIQEGMWQPLSGTETGLVAYYGFNEGSGSIAHDAASNHLDALLVNGPTWINPPVPVPVRPGDQTIEQGASITLQLTLTQPGLSAQNLTASVVSLNPVLLPNSDSAIWLEGSGFIRTLHLVPAPGLSGAAAIQVRISDGISTVSYTFTLNVLPHRQNPLLCITNAAPLSPQTLRLQFRDDGTGSTNYQVQFRKGFSATNSWITVTNVGPGQFHADVMPPPGNQGFFRVAGLRASMAIFNSPDFKVDEGAGLVPAVIVFDGPFQGTLFYSLSGMMGSGVYTNLTGTLQVNGNTAVIPIALPDNQAIEPTRYLTLRLESGSGYQVGASPQSTIVVEDNDADWQGGLRISVGPLASAISEIVYSNNAARITKSTAIPLNNSAGIDFVLQIRNSGQNLSGTLTSAGFGFFPAQGMPAQLTLTRDYFSARISSVQLPADSSLLNVPIWLDLQLTAQNGQPNQTNTPTQVSGNAVLGIQYEGLPHLNTTNRGTFLLIKPPAKLHTNEVRLVTSQP